MRKVLFCNIAWMEYYNGVNSCDEPQNGGSWVSENKEAYEEFNFKPVYIKKEAESYCLGFVETKSTNGKTTNQLHIENIINSNAKKNDEFIKDVLVVWCAKSLDNDFTSIVGWYKNATVYRKYKNNDYCDKENRKYNICAKAKDCVLLPIGLRNRRTFSYVPRKGKNSFPSYGFGRSNIWFAREDTAVKWVNDTINKINQYDKNNTLIKNYEKGEEMKLIIPEEISDEYYVSLKEGAKKEIIVNAYERNLEARKKCIEYYGAICCVCGFDAEKVYGEYFKGKIHIHHIKPLSEIDEEYEVNPIEDLRPVCPNCHMIIHSNKRIYSIEELKRILGKYN